MNLFRTAMLILGSVFLLGTTASAQDDLDNKLVQLKSCELGEQNRIVKKILESQPKAETILAALRKGVGVDPNADRQKKLVAGWSAWEATDLKGVKRPYQIYLPKSFTEGKPLTAAIVHMHGAVGKPNFGTGLGSPAATGYAGFLWPKLAEKENWIIISPIGRDECAWWTDNGVMHVNAVLRDVRRSLDIPASSIFASGFSDGGSGCYYRAMVAPDPFAGFIAMNGHPRVASSASGRQIYLPNLAMTSTVAAMTQEDSLYPSKSVLPHIVTALQHGADVLTISYPKANHQPLYFDDQQQTIINFIKKTKRIEPTRIRWFASDPSIGKCSWLDILEVASKSNSTKLNDEAQVMSVPGPVKIGIRFARDGSLAADDVVKGSVAFKAGFKSGDVLIKFDDRPISTARELRGLLAKKSNGDSFSCKVRRGKDTVSLKGKFPPFESKPVYQRENPTAIVECEIRNDSSPQVVVETVNAIRVRIWLPEEMAGLDQLDVAINGKPTTKLPVVQLNAQQLLKRYAKSADEFDLRRSYVDIKIPSKK